MPVDDLRDQIEELVMLQRVDQELGATLDFENVLMLTMDWALRRTGASAGMYSKLTPDGTGLIPIITLGYPPGTVPYDDDNPCPVTVGIAGRAVRTREPQIVRKSERSNGDHPLMESTRSEIAMPIEIRDKLLGVIYMEAEQEDTFSQADIDFLRRLAARAAIALDHARLYREAEARADEMAALYAASRLISSSLERPDALVNAAQSIATVLRVSSVVIADCRLDRDQITVAAVYRLPTARNAMEVLPALGDVFDLNSLPEIQSAINSHRSYSVSTVDSGLSPRLLDFMNRRLVNTMLILPLTVPLTAKTTRNELLGVALAIEGRRPRRFTDEELQMAEALAGQIASALRQVKLYEDVRELETIKSEMIRMASHDLRNPLGNVMGYFELLTGSLKDLNASELDWEFVQHIRNALQTMRRLIEDLLTLERVESERQAAWVELNFSELVSNVADEQRYDAEEVKKQTLSTQIEDLELQVFGSSTQLRQAVTNLVNNAIKYTPEKGNIKVRLSKKDKRLIFEVQDNGYGISKERQQRLFSKFYRAHQPGTDHISGTGLGLSLVKTVIERHGGEVWVHSEPGIGSTFGFWLPLSRSLPIRPE